MPQSTTTLVVYFSRPGENYFNGGRIDLAVGNTQVVADLIVDLVPVAVHRLVEDDPYPRDYNSTVARNVTEQVRNARPTLAGPPPNLAAYDTILLGSPIWNVQPPMIMRTFTDAVDLTGKSLYPFTTHAMSGLGRALAFYRDAAPAARIGEGLAVRGEEAVQARPVVATWLRSIGLLD